MLALTITAELEGVTDLVPEDTEANPFYYTFKVQCTSCREIHPNWVSVSRFEQNEQSGSKGEANFVWRCKNCKREHSANIIDAPKTYSQQSPAKPKNIITIDCRGLEFVEFKADGDWKAVGIEKGTKFESIDLSEGEWFDYDEKAGEEVSIKDIKFGIKRA
ncbi:Putative CXXC motif containing zinc binding protein [Septoria linicola]|uniref:CXXC motif containing zinc binding protein n=1 Tax=Septoria linicola TaxID=215465 RepID=A0A9Q9B236_9PEZI|nr:Putative CXXC motif containing zinc binding protein [Septoria linicola]